MTIRTASCSEVLRSDYLQAVLSNKVLIQQLARQLVAQHVEAHIDMLSDMPGEYTTFAAAETYLKSARETVEDYVEDLLTEFRGELYDAIRSRNVIVKNVMMDKSGVTDADVVVE
jgi:hypothetical protein